MLVCHDVAHLVRQHASQFVVAAGERYHLPRHVDAAACETECVYFGQVDEKETESQIVGRKVTGQSGSKFLKMRGERGIFDENKFASQAVAHGVAQIDFLLIGEDRLPSDSFERGRLRA